MKSEKQRAHMLKLNMQRAGKSPSEIKAALKALQPVAPRPSAKSSPEVKLKPLPATPPVLASSFDLDRAYAAIAKRIPEPLLSLDAFPDQAVKDLYISIFIKFVEEVLPEGSTILQVLIAERASYYWTRSHCLEKETGSVSPDYQFHVAEFNRSLAILRELALKNLPEQQMKIIAKKTISTIERIVLDPVLKVELMREVIHEFSVELPSAKVSLASLAPSASSSVQTASASHRAGAAT